MTDEEKKALAKKARFFWESEWKLIYNDLIHIAKASSEIHVYIVQTQCFARLFPLVRSLLLSVFAKHYKVCQHFVPQKISWQKSWLTCRHDIYLFAATRKHFYKHDNNINVDIQYLTAKTLLSEKQTLPVIIHPAHNYN